MNKILPLWFVVRFRHCFTISNTTRLDWSFILHQWTLFELIYLLLNPTPLTRRFEWVLLFNYRTLFKITLTPVLILEDVDIMWQYNFVLILGITNFNRPSGDIHWRPDLPTGDFTIYNLPQLHHQIQPLFYLELNDTINVSDMCGLVWWATCVSLLSICGK